MFAGANMSNYGGTANNGVPVTHEQDIAYRNELRTFMIKVRQ